MNAVTSYNLAKKIDPSDSPQTVVLFLDMVALSSTFMGWFGGEVFSLSIEIVFICMVMSTTFGIVGVLTHHRDMGPNLLFFFVFFRAHFQKITHPTLALFLRPSYFLPN